MSHDDTEPQPDHRGDLPAPRWYGSAATLPAQTQREQTQDPTGPRPAATAQDVGREFTRPPGLAGDGEDIEDIGDVADGRDRAEKSDAVEPAADYAAEGRPAALGPDASVRDISRAARAAFVGKDLVQSGPAVWPFGRRAHQRRARNHQAATEARRRRAQFRDAFTTQATPGATRPHRPRWRSVDRRTNALIIACLAGVVLAIIVAAVWLDRPDPPRVSEPAPPSQAATSATTLAATDSAAARTTVTGPITLPSPPPIPTGGVGPVTPHPGTAVDPRSVQPVAPPTGDPTAAELATPEGAMRAWLARLCPFDFTHPFGTAEQRARPAMTDAGWDTLDPHRTDNADRARASWDKTVAACESGRCATPAVTVSPEAPRSPSSAIVIGTAARLVTTQSGDHPRAHTPYVEELSEVRLVRRGADGLWRVDLATVGG